MANMIGFLVGLKGPNGEHTDDGVPVTADNEQEAIAGAMMYYDSQDPADYWIERDPDNN